MAPFGAEIGGEPLLLEAAALPWLQITADVHDVIFVRDGGNALDLEVQSMPVLPSLADFCALVWCGISTTDWQKLLLFLCTFSILSNKSTDRHAVQRNHPQYAGRSREDGVNPSQPRYCNPDAELFGFVV
jgi:hypothetical protein